MFIKCMSKLEDLESKQNYMYISRLVLFYTFVGVTYLLFFKSNPQCVCPSFNNQSTKQILSTNTLFTTETKIENTTTTTTPDTSIISACGSRNLLATNTTIRSVKRNHELIQNLYSMLPNGIILLWYGSISTIPSGWSLCNGTNGTPDLRDKFVMGGGNAYTLDDNGGSFDITLTNNDIPSHTHNISPSNVVSSTQNSHNHGTGTLSLSTQSAHTHTFSTTSSSSGLHNHGPGTLSLSTQSSHSHSFSDTSSSNGDHRHSFSDTSASSGDHRHNVPYANYGFGVSMDITNISGMNWIPDDNYYIGTDDSGTHSHSISGYTNYPGSHTHSVSGNTGSTGSHSHTLSGTTATVSHHTHSVSGTTGSSLPHSHTISGSSSSSGGHSHTVSGFTDSIGGGNTITILNPYYTAYYIMKIPHTFPTDDPTESPTLSPSIAPSIAPSLNPTLAPSNNPTTAPSHNPTEYPTNAPSNAPSIVPSQFPTIAPFNSPSKAPTQLPSLTPTLAPIFAPTVSPASYPSSAPTISPTCSPSLAPSLQPTLAPILTPTLPPSSVPSTAPSLMPTLSPSMAPSTPPSNAPSIPPSIAPSLTPTSMPTPTCWDAKYKWYMIKSVNLNRNDILLSGESLVSINCRFILTMKENGNLVLNGLVGRYIDPFEKDDNGIFINDDNKMRMYIGWETNTTIEDNSDESTSVAQLKDGTLMVEEHEFYGVPEFDPIELWKSDEYVDENELILQLSDNGCLTLNKYYGSTNTHHLIPIWVVCAELEKDRNDNNKNNNELSTTIVITSKISSTEIPKNDVRLNIDNNNDKIQLLTIWNVIISSLLIVILFAFLYVCIKRLYNNYEIGDSEMHAAIRTASKVTTAFEEESMDECDKAIELWSMETTNVTNRGQEIGK